MEVQHTGCYSKVGRVLTLRICWPLRRRGALPATEVLRPIE